MHGVTFGWVEEEEELQWALRASLIEAQRCDGYAVWGKKRGGGSFGSPT